MARKESTAAKQNKASKKNAGPLSTTAWNIKGTGIFGATKEELKPERRELNKAAGVVEAEVSSNAWPYRITKGAGHPHNQPVKVLAVAQKVKKALDYLNAA